jgi:alanyl-tRNA synthetase
MSAPFTANDLRRAFTDFFAARGHEPVPSASLIPHDPTILFTVAGMVPFIPYMTGLVPAPYKRATSVQKCVRTLDIDEVKKKSGITIDNEQPGQWKSLV